MLSYYSFLFVYLCQVAKWYALALKVQILVTL
uniref:Uncharacterized protein n=1 Tax=Siphoviridae sp. ctlHU7 TaxID=2827588 RepID=A0A8S5LIB7_9CAUD|nr:MAG TPA: hypothetical protein [Siphoviridae sp. ctlHU7]